MIIVFNMTYDEYKSSKNEKIKKNYLKVLLNKLFTVVIFTMLVVIISNHSPKFRKFIIDKVLNSTFDFSYVNKILNKSTDIFKNSETKSVSSLINIKEEKYKDGIKYILNSEQKVYIKEGGIVTFIGEKEGYNNTVIVQQSNGYYAWYGNVKESIKLYDYLESGSEIGTAKDEYYYVLLKDDKVVTNES